MKILDTGSRRLSRTIVGLTALLFGSILVPSTTHAGQDGQDPTYCSGSSPVGVKVITGYAGIAGGFVDLRYSNNCGIAWTRVCIAGGNGYNARHINRSQPAGHTLLISSLASASGSGSCTGGLGVNRQYTYAVIDANCSDGGPLPDWGGSCSAYGYGKIFWLPPGGGTSYGFAFTSNY